MKNSLPSLTRHGLAALSLAGVLLGGALASPAALMTLSPAASCASTNDVVNSGSALAAYCCGPTTTVNGTLFTSNSIATGALGSYLNLSGFGTANANAFIVNTAPFNALSSSYSNILKGAIYNATTNTTGTLTLTNLTPGHQYALQLWVGDPRAGATTNRAETIGTAASGGSQVLKFNATQATGGVGQFTIGGFTADAVTQPVSVAAPGYGMVPQVNTLQLRDVSNIGNWNGLVNGNVDATTTNFCKNYTNATLVQGSLTAVQGLSPNVVFADTFYSNAVAIPVTTSNLTVAAGGMTLTNTAFLNNNVNYAFSSADAAGIKGNSTVTMLGAGTVSFNGPNTYTGPTVVKAGTLQLNTSTGNAISGNLTVNGGTLRLLQSNQIADTNTVSISAGSTLDVGANNDRIAGLQLVSGTITGTGTITNNTATYDLQSGTVAPVLAGTVGLTKSGTGTVILSNANLYAGTTTVSSGGGTLQITSPNGLGTGNITIAKGGGVTGNLQLNLTGVNTITNTFNGFNSTTFAGDVTTNDIENVSGTNTITSALTVTGTGGNGVAVKSDAGLLILAGNIGSTIASRGVELNGPGNGVVNGAITNAGVNGFSCSKDGTGTWTLNGANLFSGGINLNNGTLALGATGSLIPNSITIKPGAVFDISASGFALAGGTLTAGRTSSPATDVNGSLTNTAGSITIAGTTNCGTLTVNGGLALAGGTLNYDLSSTGSTNDQIAINGALNLSGTTTLNVNWINSLPAAGTYALISGGTSLASGGTNNFVLGTGLISSSRSLFTLDTTTTPGTVYLVVTATPAQLVWTGTNGIPWDTTTTNWLNGGLDDMFAGGDNVTFDDTAYTTTVDISTVNVLPTSMLFTNDTQNYTVTGSKVIGGTTGLTKTGTGTLTLGNAANTYTGNTTITAGKLVLGAAGVIPSGAGKGSVTVNGTLDVAGLSPTVNNLAGAGTVDDVAAGGAPVLTVNALAPTTFSGVIQNSSGSLSLLKTGASTLALSGANNYLGTTTISGGTLSLTAANTLPTGTTVTFSGTGALNVNGVSQTIANLTLADGVAATGTGTGGTLTVTGGTDCRIGNLSAAGTASLNLSALNNFTYNNSSYTFDVGGQYQPAGSGNVSTYGNLLLATNSTITASQFSIGDLGSSVQATSYCTGMVAMAQSTIITANTIRLGMQTGASRATPAGVLQFQNGASNPTLMIRATDGVSRVPATIVMGEISSSAYPAYALGKIDLTTGVAGSSTLDALVSQMNIGQNIYANNSPVTGTVLMGGGKLDATTLLLGTKSSTGTGSVNGSLSLSGGTVTANTITLGDQQGSSGTVIGTFTLNSGTVQAQTIQPGAGTATRTFNWNDGVITNYDASTDLTIAGGMTLTLGGSGTPTLGVGASRTATVNAALAGAALTKTGNGILILGGTNTYTGSTTVNGGTLQVNNLMASTTLTVNAGGFGLNNVPWTNTTTTFGAGATTLTFNGNGTSVSGRLVVTGSGGYTNSAALTVNVTGSLPGTGTYTLITYSGTANDTGSYTPGTLPPRMTGYVTNNASASAVQLVVLTADEPRWSGALNSEWSVNPLTVPKNWVLQSDGITPTDFMPNDNVLFDDTCSNTTVDVSVANVTPGTLTFNNSASNYVVTGSQAIAGPTSLLKRGTGSVTLANVNTYTGGTVVSNGTLVLAADLAIAPGVTVQGGTLQIGDGVAASGSVSGTIVNNSQVALNRPDDLTFANVVSGTGSIVQKGVNTITLSAANTHTGGLTINSGKVKLAGTSPLGANGAQVTIQPGGQMDYNGEAFGSVNTRGFSFTAGGSGPDGSGAIINSTGSIVSYANVSNLTLTADTVIGGNGTRWDIGTGATGPTVNGNGHNLTKVGTTAIDVRPQFITNLVSITINNGDLHYEAFSQTNAWTATTTNYATPGTSLGALGSITLNMPVVLDSATLLNEGSGTPVWSGPVTLASASIFSSAGGSQTVSGPIGGPGGITVINGTSTVTLSGMNTYAGGTTVSAGTLSIFTGTNLGTGPLSFTAASTLNIAGTAATVTNDISLPASVQVNLVTPNTSSTVLNGVISGGDASSILFFQGGASGQNSGALTLNGNNTLQGTIDVERGPLILGNYNAAGTATIKLNSNNNPNGALQLAGNFTITNNVTLFFGTQKLGVATGVGAGINGIISGSLGFEKVGAGSLALGGANNYTGPTTVSAGTLLINGTSGAGAVTNAAFTTLGGNGTISGPVSVSAGGNLAAGGVGTIGTLTAGDGSGSALTLNGGTILCDFPASGPTCDLIAVTGNLVLNGTNHLTPNLALGGAAGTYTVMTYAAQTGTGTLTFPNGTTNQYNATLSVDVTSVTVTVGAGGLTSQDVWAGGASGVWDGGALNWVKSGTPSSAYAAGDYVVFDDTALGNFTVSSGGAVAPGAVTVNNTTNAYTLSATIAGAGTSLLKLGANTLTLAGANTYSGGTTISAGTVSLGIAENAGISGPLGSSTSAGAVVMGGGALQYSGVNQYDYSARFSTVAGQSYSADTAGQAVTWATALTSSGGTLTLTNSTGTGTLTLTGTNTYTGATAINGGTLTIGGAGLLGNGAYAGLITDNAALIYNSSAAQTLSGVISGSGSLTDSGSGTLTVSAIPTYTGNTTINAGKITFTNSATWAIPGNIVINGGTFNIIGGTRAANLAFGKTISFGTSGGGVLNVNGLNFYALAGGTPAVMAITTTGGANDQVIASATSGVNIGLNIGGGGLGNGTCNFTVAPGTDPVSDLTVTAPLWNTVSSGMVKNGAGRLTLSGVSTYGGTTTINAGTMSVNGSLGASPVTVTTNATLGGSGSVSNATVQAGGTILGGDANHSNTLTVATLNLGSSSTDVTYSKFTVAAGGKVAATTALNVTGTNIVTILDPSLTVGTNTLFTYSGSIGGGSGFAGFQLATLPAGVTANLLNTGSAVQLAVTSTYMVNTNSPVMTNSVSGGTLTLSWPADHLGWRLEVQTNSLNAGLGTTWFTWPNSTNVTTVPITLDPTAPTVFFRLVYP